MHQHPRSPAAPAPVKPPDLTRAGYLTEKDYIANSPSIGQQTNSNKGLGIATEPPEQPQKNAAVIRESLSKLNQIVSSYHTKAALIILHSRVDLPPCFSKGSHTPKVNRWFNVELDDTDATREELRAWRTCDSTENRPSPLVIETYLDTNGLTNNQSLVILDENGKRWDVRDSLVALRGAHSTGSRSRSDEMVILERWRIELGEPSGKLPADLGSILPTVYKKSIVLFRSLFTYSKFLPAWKFAKRNLKLRANPALKIKYRILNGHDVLASSDQDYLAAPLYSGCSKVVDTYSFGVTESPAGPFSIKVTYRTNCDFRVDDSEALLSSRFMGADDEIFRPSLPSRNLDKVRYTETGSVPIDRTTVEYPDRSRAYGSLSSFHQVGPTTGTSPISALRAVGNVDASSQSPSDSYTRRITGACKVSPVGRVAVLANEGAFLARRPSISLQPFKAPPLSASPSLVDPPLSASPRTGSFQPTSDPKYMPPPAIPMPTRRPIPGAHENTVPSPSPASAKPVPISRYSSAFGQRRARHVSGTANRTEDDISSGRASAASSAAQPGSGLLAEAAGTSAESVHTDDENISEFLKMLDLRKDLLSPGSSPGLDANRRGAALARFQRMRDSNALLSDSMSSSSLLQRSYNPPGKPPSGVPPILGGTSASTDSSPGKQMSPHTPHTPAIPSRLSSNSIVDYDRIEDRTSVLPHQGRGSPVVNNSSGEATQRVSSTAIDIPKSPRMSAPSIYRRSNSAANRRPISADDDEIFPFGMRSVSLGNENKSHTSLSAMLQQQGYKNLPVDVGQLQKEAQSPAPPDPIVAPGHEADHRRGVSYPGYTGTPLSSSHRYQSRISHSRGRGSSRGPHSISSTSSSLARGAMLPPHLAERDQDHEGNGSGSNSGVWTAEMRRGVAQRSSPSRAYTPQAMVFDEDEPLLFAMSDFGASKRSLEESRQCHSTDCGEDTGSSRRGGSGRRGAPFPSFHAWS